MKKTLTKITAATLAVLTVLFTFCFTSFAAEEKGGARVYNHGKTYYYEEISDAWAKAIKLTGHVEITLYEDWKADEKGYFGKGDGFADGSIYISGRQDDLVINLNGYKIDRGLTEAKKYGYVIFIRNSKNIIITDFSRSGRSNITGGNSKGDAGAIMIVGSCVVFKSIQITNNVCANRGGALDIVSGTSVNGKIKSDVQVMNCRITDNKAKTGGAVFVDSENTLRVFDSVITNNKAVNDAGIHTEVGLLARANIYLGGTVTIADNIAEKDGTGLTLDESFFTKAYVKYEDGRPLRDNSRIVILSKTGDKTLRITADSDKTYIGCYEYENDSYEIVAKGSGDSQYLDIKKI